MIEVGKGVAKAFIRVSTQELVVLIALKKLGEFVLRRIEFDDLKIITDVEKTSPITLMVEKEKERRWENDGRIIHGGIGELHVRSVDDISFIFD